MNLRLVLPMLLCVLALAGPRIASAANDLDEVTRLHHAGQTTAALQRADEFLAKNPRDAQMRFLKAVILSDAKRGADAIAVLEKLIADYPDLAEPYNNLAVLYAASGQYARARTALEQALQLRPGYATAHENLGDVDAALAVQAYATALRLDPGRAGVAAKMALAQQIAAPASAPSAADAASAVNGRR